MLIVNVGKTIHEIKDNEKIELKVSFNKDRLEYWDENPPLSGPVSKSFLQSITQVSIYIQGESRSNSPVEINAAVCLSISQARELAESLLRSAREAEASIEEHGQDG